MAPRAWKVFATAGLLVAAFLAACSVEKHHKTLSFFFDGVPDPNAPPPPPPEPGPTGPTLAEIAKMTSAERAKLVHPFAIIRPPKFTVHEPFAEGRCDDCHASEALTPGVTSSFGPTFEAGVQRLVAPPDELCFKCHEEPVGEWIHGPAAVGDCGTCHMPHQSPYPALLIEGKESVLCGRCHTPELFVTAEAHLAWTATCSSCHDPHAGARHGLLKPDAPLADNTILPATEPGN